MKHLLLDIMVNGEFFGQVAYPETPKVKGGVEPYDNKKIESFILNRYPSLKNKKYRIEFSNQKV